MSRDASSDLPPSPGGGGRVGESRLPMAVAVVLCAGLFLLLPAEFRLVPYSFLVYPAVLLGLLGVLVVGDPGRIDRTRPWLRTTTGLLVALITAATAGAVLRLVLAILEGEDFGGAGRLLAIGAIVWTTQVIAYALWYWHLDAGGPVARSRGMDEAVRAFHFPEHDLTARIDAGWYPQFIDYFALSFSAGTTFGPTDVSAVRHWSKLWLVGQSALSLALIGLVLARAINEL